MEMKNKLQKHHKSKAHFVLRDFSVGVSSVCGFFALIALPTYISVNNQIKKPANASEETTSYLDEEKVDNLQSYENLNVIIEPINDIELPMELR